jgi:dolichyl-phosphate beta-glucosyltransferase
MSLSEMKGMWEIIKDKQHCQIIMGCRHKRMGVQIERSIVRHYLGRVFAAFASSTLQIAVYDTQCGAKILKTEHAGEIFGKPFLSKWFFDVEILNRLLLVRDLYLHTIIEYPFNKWRGIEGSKLRFLDFLITPFELARIHFNYRRKGKSHLEALTKYK